MNDEMQKRRDALAPIAAPGRPYEYVVELRRRLPAGKKRYALVVRYVPDRLVLTAEGLTAYLKLCGKDVPATIEALADRVLTDLLNELIPFWLELLVEESEEGVLHRVLREERQPDWDNPSLLARLAPL